MLISFHVLVCVCPLGEVPLFGCCSGSNTLLVSLLPSLKFFTCCGAAVPGVMPAPRGERATGLYFDEVQCLHFPVDCAFGVSATKICAKH